MSAVGELVETGFGALVLAFGIVASAAIYSSGSIVTVSDVATRFTHALSMTVYPGFSLAAVPNVFAFAVGVAIARALNTEELELRAAALLATYLFLTVLYHYASAPV